MRSIKKFFAFIGASIITLLMLCLLSMTAVVILLVQLIANIS